MEKWSRPNPPRLNDTEAIVRGGVNRRTYMPRGGLNVNYQGILVETHWVPEHAFDNRSSSKFASNPRVGSESLDDACKAIPKGC